ncbi:MAG TPA: CotH kinase family protein [Vicinamibacterales bacterium]
MTPDPIFIVRLTLLAMLLASTPATAQTQDELFDDTKLQDIHVRMSDRDWTALRVNLDDDTFYPADLVWNGLTVRNVALRQRGSGSRTASKPNLRVDVNRYISAQRFVGLAAVNLDNVYSDASMMRDPLAMEVFDRMGVPAPRQVHARLFVNDTFAGVYVVVEPVDRRFIARVFGESEAEVESGGYLYEYRWVDEYDFSYLGTALSAYSARFRAQTRDTDSMSNLYSPIEALIRAINVTPPERFAAETGRLLDLPQVARFLAVQNCAAELDGLVGYWGTNNFYVYRFRDGRPAVLIPWDADHSLSSPDMPLSYRLDATVLTRRILAVPSLAQAYVAAVSECASVLGQPAPDDARGWLEREIRRRAALIGPSVALDRYALFNFGEFLLDVDNLLNFARHRPSYLHCQVDEAVTTGSFGNQCPVPPTSTPTPGIASRPTAE